MPDLYGDDGYAWTQAQAQVIRTGNWGAIDRERLAEAVEEGWKSELYPHQVQSRPSPLGPYTGTCSRSIT
jgi:hypothetical protein